MKAALAVAACSVLAAACTPAQPADIGRSTGSSEAGDTAGSSRAYPLNPASDATTTEAPTTSVVVTTPATTEPPPALELPEPPTTVAVRRTTSTTERPTQLAPVVHDEDFWYRLAMCESGAGAASPNMFQFMGGTAEKVGYYPGASYAEQRAMAIDWAARIHPNEGTTSGWPVCWWKAGGS